MKLKSKLMMFTAAMALSTGMAMSAISGTDVVSTYQAQNYTYIEVKEGPTQIKVEAIKDGMQIEVIYDKVTGDVISTESGVASAKDAAQTGVSVKTVKADFEKDDKSGNDDLDTVDEVDDGDDDSDDDNDSHGEDNDSDDDNDSHGQGNDSDDDNEDDDNSHDDDDSDDTDDSDDSDDDN